MFDFILYYNKLTQLNLYILEANQCSKKKLKCDTETVQSYYENIEQSIGITDGKSINKWTRVQEIYIIIYRLYINS